MNTYEFVVAVITGLPGLLAAIAAFYHSFQTRKMVKIDRHFTS